MLTESEIKARFTLVLEELEELFILARHIQFDNYIFSQ